MHAAVIVIVLLLLALPARAGEKFTVHGFAMSTYLPKVEPSDHVRIILTNGIRSDLLAKIVLTPIGPISQLSYAELIWSEPTKGIKSITAGRTLPVFGRIWYDRRVDQVPVIFYSDINLPLAAIDTGATVVGAIQRFQWTVGAYTGDAVFGNNRSPNLSLRGEYRVDSAITVGASQRVSAVPATGFDTIWKIGSLVVTGESVAAKGETAYALLGEFHLTPRTSFALQYEWLTHEKRWTSVITQGFGCFEAKLGFQLGQNDRLIGQAVLRW